MKNIVCWSFGLTALAMSLLAGCPKPQPPRSAEIRRTSFGIPHVKAEDEAGLGYGVGYAAAQDDFCLLAEIFVLVNGERSKHFGPDLQEPYLAPATYRELDYYVKLINDDASLARMWSRQLPEIKALLQGFAAGYNRYLAETTPGKLPTACRGAKWTRPISEMDLLRLARFHTVGSDGFQFAKAAFDSQPPTRSPPAAGRRTEAPTAPLPWSTRERVRNQAGSNAVALGSSATETGRGMLLGNPHLPWFGSLRFYEMHLSIPGKLDVMGAGLAGLPVVAIGFNSELAWSHTVNTSRHYTLFSLTLDGSDPTKYLVDGRSRAMSQRTITIEVKNGAGEIVPESRVYYSSEYGPIVVSPTDGLSWTTTQAFAVRNANQENDRFMEQSYRLGLARTLDDFRTAIHQTLGLPWVDTIAVDKGGRTFFSDVSVVPNVSTAKVESCVPAPFQPYLQDRTFFLDGSRAACNWEIATGTPQPGIFPAVALPELMGRTDYVQNSNDGAWLTNYEQPLTRYPLIVSADGIEQGLRTRIGLRQIRERLYPTSGPAHKFTLDALKDLVTNNRVYLAELVSGNQNGLAAGVCSGEMQVILPDIGRVVDLTEACAVLLAWDRKANLSSVGMALFQPFMAHVLLSKAPIWSERFDPQRPLDTPSGLNNGSLAVVAAMKQSLARTVNELNDRSIPLDSPWGRVQVAVRGSTAIPIHGGSSEVGVYNSIESNPLPMEPKNGVNSGSSYLQVVTWDDRGPVADSFLTYSLSTDPASPHFADQTKRFSDKEWIRLPFLEADIRADPELRTTLLSE